MLKGLKLYSYFFLSDVMCVSEKSYLKKKKKYWPNRVWCILYPNYVFKITYQILPNVNISVFFYINSGFEYRINKWKVDTQLFETKQALTFNNFYQILWFFKNLNFILNFLKPSLFQIVQFWKAEPNSPEKGNPCGCVGLWSHKFLFFLGFLYIYIYIYTHIYQIIILIIIIIIRRRIEILQHS